MTAIAVDDGIVLRRLELSHVDALFSVTQADRAYLRAWLPWVDDVRTADDTRTFVQMGLHGYERGEGMQCGVWVDGRLCGAVGHHTMSVAHRRTNVGYWLASAMQGKGVMTRACRAFVHHSIRDLGMHRIELRAAVDNVRSRAIADRLGMTLEGVARDAEWLYDRFVDLAVYAVLEPDWGPPPLRR